jgi:hypothetical protein
MIISSSVLVKMRNVAPKFVEKIKKNTLIMFNNFLSENRAIYEIPWKNMVEIGRPQMGVWLMRLACWISKATNSH